MKKQILDKLYKKIHANEEEAKRLVKVVYPQNKQGHAFIDQGRIEVLKQSNKFLDDLIVDVINIKEEDY